MRKNTIHSHISKTNKIETLNKIAILGALSIFLSAIEYLFPKPLPFLRLGLANIPLLLALQILNLKSYFFLILLKILGQALINGTLASYVFLFSICGSLSSAIIMFSFYNLLKDNISFIGLSIFGALAANLIQLLLSVKIIFSSAAWKILPLFLGIGIISGFFVGLLTEYFSKHSLWWQAFSETKKDTSNPKKTEKILKTYNNLNWVTKKKKDRKKILKPYINPLVRFLTGLLVIPPLLFSDDLTKRLILFIFFVLLNYLLGKGFKYIYFLILISSITLFNALNPMGRILFQIGSFKITEDALKAGFIKALGFASLILISQFSVSKNLRLPGKLGGLISRAFYFMEKLLAAEIKIDPSSFFTSLDKALINALPVEEVENNINTSIKDTNNYNKYIGTAFIIFTASLVWIVFLIKL